MKLAVVGPRTFTDYTLLSKELSKYKPDEIVSGGAQGADNLAEKYAYYAGIPVTIFKPNWDKFGKSAGFVRNSQIVEYADGVVAFWDKTSKGTEHSINLAKKANKKVTVIITV